ncbi:MAG TPA: SDR family oxidoreductase [Hyphomicrobiaceae bacterium]|jgi:NAD(P)-dependent dehydrogenase (short-subunit alcohol dehydrogenase family)
MKGSAKSHEPTILVTGGASGIGRATVEAVLSQGWKAIVADRDGDSLNLLRETLRPAASKVVFEQLDVADEAAVVATIARCDAEYGPIGGVVNSAGIGRGVPALETSVDLFREILSVNLIGTFVVSREIARLMRSRGGGSIVNIASVSGLRGIGGRAAYGASKGGIVTLTKVMAVELAPFGVRVNAIAPGPIETPMVVDMHTAEVRAAWLASVPQRRYGSPNEVARAAIFLLNETDSSFVTGHTLTVDGGFSIAGNLGGTPGP